MRPPRSGNAPEDGPELGSPRNALAAIGLLSLLVIVFYAPVLLAVRTFPEGDFTHHFLPFSEFASDAWRSLQLPLWNPHTYSGHPFLADVQAAVFYPVSSALLLLTLPFKSASARLYFLELEAMIHVLLAGCFTFLLAKELTGRFWASMLAGITFMLSGYLTGYPPLQLAVMRTAGWLPLLMWLLLRAWNNPRLWRYWTGSAVVYAVAFLAGHTQTWLYLTYAVGGWLAVLALGIRPSREADANGALIPRLLGLTSLVAIAAGLVAIQLLPSLEFARLSVRADVDYAFLSGGFPVRDTWQMLLPGVLTHFSPLYVGVAAFGMALFGAAGGVLQGLRRSPAEQTDAAGSDPFLPYGAGYFLALTLFGLLASYGDYGFLYPFLYRLAPGWDLFRGQERAAYLVAFALSMLAGYGLALVPTASPVFRRRHALLYAALITAAVYAFGLLWQLPGRTAVGHWQYLGIATVTLVLAMCLAVVLWLDGWSVRREWLICGLAAVNLLWANGATNLQNRTPRQAVHLMPEATAVRDAVTSTGGDASGLDGRVYNEYRVYEDYGMRVRVEDAWGSSPLRLSRYASLFDDFPLDRMFRLTGVGHVLTWRKELFEPSELVAEYPKQDDATYLHRLLEANPRIWTVANVVSADDSRAAELLADHEFDLDRVAVLASEQGAVDWSGSPKTARIRAVRPRTNRLQIEVSNSGGGVLVVSENWMPGWRVENIECMDEAGCDPATVHESGLPLLAPVRANLSFIAIALPEADVRFDLAYAPDSVRTGTAVSCVTLFILIVSGGTRLLLSRQRKAA